MTCKLAGIPNGVYPQEVLVREIGPDEVILQSAGGSHGHIESSQGEMDCHTGRQLLCDRGAVKDHGSRFGLHCLGHDAVCISALEGGEHELSFCVLPPGGVGQELTCQALLEAHAFRDGFGLLVGEELPETLGTVVPADGGEAPDCLKRNFLGIFHTGHCQHGVKGAGHAQGAGGDGAGFHQALAPETPVAGGGVVAGGHHHVDARRPGGVVNFRHALVIMRTTGGTQGQVGAVHAQGNGVFHSGNQVVEVAHAVHVKHLHDDQLCLRGNAQGLHVELLLDLLRQIARHNASHVGAVAQAGVVIGAEVGQAVCVVEAEGNLAAVVHGVQAGLLGQGFGVEVVGLQNGGDVLLGVGHPALVLGLLDEAGVFVAEAGVEDGHAHALALIAQVPGPGCAHGRACGVHIGQELRSGLDHRSLRFRHREGRHQKGGLDPGLPIQLLEVAVLHCDGDGVGQEGEVVRNLQVIAQLLLQGLGLHGLPLGDAGHSGLLRLPQGLAQEHGHAGPLPWRRPAHLRRSPWP